MADTSPLYRRLPPEPWGRRLLRAREDLAGLNLDQAAALAGKWVLTTGSTISRLETCSEVPDGRASSVPKQCRIWCGGDLLLVATLMGHESTATTMGYVRLTPGLAGSVVATMYGDAA